MEFVNPIFNCFMKNIMLYISIQKFYVTSTQNSINGTLCVYYCVSVIFEKLTTDKSFLDINIKIVGNQLHFDIYHKPTNSFSYLKYNSCHLSHTKNNISLSLARCIIELSLTFTLQTRKTQRKLKIIPLQKAFKLKIRKKKINKSEHLQVHITQIIILITTVSIIS